MSAPEPQLSDEEEETLLKLVGEAEESKSDLVAVPTLALRRALGDLRNWAMFAVGQEQRLAAETATARARNKGSGDFSMGTSISQCPFTDEKLKLAWIYGWEAAQAMHKAAALEAEVATLRSLLAKKAKEAGI